MADDIPWIINTQNTLGTIVTNPQLSSKLLNRPPFKFLHDVVQSFMAKTKLMKDLFTPDELDASKAGASRESKMGYLDKLITFLCNATGQSLPAKSVNIVAGKEAQATNEMLVALHSLTTMPPQAVAAAVARTTGAAPPPGSAGARSSPRKQRGETPERGRSRGQQEEGGADKKPEENNNNNNNRGGAAAAAPAAAGGRPGTAQARKPPPSVRSHETIIEDRNVETVAVAGVIVEGGDAAGGAGGAQQGADASSTGDKQKDWQKLVEQHENATTSRAAHSGGAGGAAGEGETKSYLVSGAQAAKAEEELRAQRQREEAAGQGEQGVRIKVHNKDHGGVVGESEIMKLREQLQLLTKASNPLGKYLEALFDDLEAMQRELDMWRNEAVTQSNVATEAKRQTQESMREVNAQLTGLDESINDQRQKVSVVRASIQRNEATIEKLIRMVINPSERK